MNSKMKSAIEKITLNDATFSNEVIEPTYVNFFYGKNGAGKSTIARTFKVNDEHLQWQAGRASADYDVLVYDTDFINANLRNYGNLAGVFTVNETNIAIQEQVDTLNAERKKMGEEYNGHKAAIDQKVEDKSTALSTFQSDCWSKSAEARTLFNEAIKGKKKAALFAQEILAITPVVHNFDELKVLYSTVFSGDAQQYNMLSKAGKVTYASLPGYELMGKPISSSSDTDFAKFIKALKATDWVRSGHTHFAGQTDGKCPYCQQKLPSNFDKEIAACFDAQYQEDIAAINSFQKTYELEMDSVVATLESNVSVAMPGLDLSEYEVKVQLLIDAITINKQRIAAKIKEPTTIASLEDTDSLLIEIGTLIDGFNKKIKENNEIVGDIKSRAGNECSLIAHQKFCHICHLIGCTGATGRTFCKHIFIKVSSNAVKLINRKGRHNDTRGNGIEPRSTLAPFYRLSHDTLFITTLCHLISMERVTNISRLQDIQ